MLNHKFKYILLGIFCSSAFALTAQAATYSYTVTITHYDNSAHLYQLYCALQPGDHSTIIGGAPVSFNPNTNPPSTCTSTSCTITVNSFTSQCPYASLFIDKSTQSSFLQSGTTFTYDLVSKQLMTNTP